jgi:hypothetical protein
MKTVQSLIATGMRKDSHHFQVIETTIIPASDGELNLSDGL